MKFFTMSLHYEILSKKCQKHHMWVKNLYCNEIVEILFPIRFLQNFTWCWDLFCLSSMQKEIGLSQFIAEKLKNLYLTTTHYHAGDKYTDNKVI